MPLNTLKSCLDSLNKCNSINSLNKTRSAIDKRREEGGKDRNNNAPVHYSDADYKKIVDTYNTRLKHLSVISLNLPLSRSSMFSTPKINNLQPTKIQRKFDALYKSTLSRLNDNKILIDYILQFIQKNNVKTAIVLLTIINKMIDYRLPVKNYVHYITNLMPLNDATILLIEGLKRHSQAQKIKLADLLLSRHSLQILLETSEKYFQSIEKTRLNSSRYKNSALHNAILLNDIENESNHLSRIHGDEFCIFLPEIEREDDVAKFIDKIYKAMSIDFNIQNKSIQISLTAGVVLGPRENDDADVLLHHAGAAVSYARNLGQTFAFYESKLDEKSSNRLLMTRELKHAIQAEELIVLYQPKVFLETGQVAGAEALVRWSHHEFGIVPADTFVLLAEQTGLINSLTNYVLKKVLAQLRKWHDTGNRISVSINISILNVIDLDFPNSVELLLRKYKVSSKYIKFEIIESAYMNNEDRAVSVIKRLSDLGIKISIDDFGTGYSSFTYLINLPISEIKIDKSFVLSMLDDNKQASVVSAIVQLGRSLNLEVVAEGVEDSVIETKLAKMGCDYGQGFYYAAALNADEFIKFTPPRNLR